MDFSEVTQLSKGIRIAKGNKVDAMMGEGREECHGGHLLATTGATRAHKHASCLAV
jgi:hypothetical protein